MYKVKQYIGTDYTPGEILPEELDRAFVNRLLKSGAIEEITPDYPYEPKTKLEAEAEGAGDQESPEDAEGEAEAEEDCEEPEAPEVDAADALIAPAKAENGGATRKQKGGKGK